MASTAAAASSMRPPRRQFGAGAKALRMHAELERWLEAERDQLALWVPVAMGVGVAAWFLLPDTHDWTIAALLLATVATAAAAVGRGDRASRAVAMGAVSALLGLGLIWARADRVAAPVLGGPVVATMTARVERIEPLTARDLVRLTLLPLPGAMSAGGKPVALPPRVRVNLATADAPIGVTPGAVLRLRARLLPPPEPAVPGAYDFAQTAWFAQIGATGRGFAPVAIVTPGGTSSGLRAGLTRIITDHIAGSAGGIAASLATGDVGSITQEDSDALRKAGLAHLLSVSGLHITAAVAATMLVVLRLLALWPWLALNTRLPLIAALAGAAAAIGYTLLTGAEVPTIRSCVAALGVLVALALGRQAMTLRLVAAGAVVVMLFWPESIAGPSFQLSFAAVTAIMALHEHPRIAGWFGAHEEGRARRMLREGGSLLLTGIVVELALMPIAVFHFHKAGVYGAVANIVAIPLTTFVVMPLEALALFFNMAGLGAPFWWLTGKSLAMLLWIAHVTAAAPGSVTAIPAMSTGAFALMMAGMTWLALWRTPVRWWGSAAILVGAVWAWTTPAPDLLVTGDGRHVALRTADGGLALLRDRTGDYARATLGENSGVLAEAGLMSDDPGSRCSRDMCVADRTVAGRRWRIAATRSTYPMPIDAFIAACRDADIVISDRRLPRTCTPRWLKLDKPALSATGGVAVALSGVKVTTVDQAGDRHPWRDPVRLNRSGAAVRKAYPARAPAWGHNAADRKRGWRDRAEPSPPRAGNI